MRHSAIADSAECARGICRARSAKVLDRAVHKWGTSADRRGWARCGKSWRVVGNHEMGMSLVMLPALRDQAGDANFLETVFSMVRASERDTEPVKSRAGTATSRLIPGGGQESNRIENAGVIPHENLR